MLSFIRKLEYYKGLESSFDSPLKDSLFDRSSNSLIESFDSLLNRSSDSLLDSSLESSNSLIKSKDNLIYYIDKIIEYQRLCILSALIKEILHLVYENGHPEF